MFQTTIGDLATKLNVEYPTAAALVKLVLAKGAGKEVGKRPTPTGKGKPATIYELPTTFLLSLDGRSIDEVRVAA
jgi:hypothetical protein